MILSVDTSGETTYVVVSNSDGSVIASRSSSSTESHNEELALSVSMVLSDARMKAEDLSTVLLGIGPGSFTGLRIGAAFVSGLCSAIKIPVYGISSFMARGYRKYLDDEKSVCAVASDARRDEYYFAIYSFPECSEILPVGILSKVAAKEAFQNHSSASCAWIEGDIDGASGMAALFGVRKDLFTLWPRDRLQDLEIAYIRPVSARTIKERASSNN